MSQTLEKVSIIPQEEPRAIQSITPMDMLDKAIQSGAGLDVIEKFMGLQERWEKNQSRKAFDNAMSSAKAEIPNITKNREVDFTSQKGRTNYRYEDLGEIARVVSPILAKHGLSYRYRTASPINEPVTVTCIVSHRDGHFEENTLCAGRDDSGNKNSIQAIGSTLTYLQRMTLKAALGLAVSNDDDGKSAVGGGGGVISEDQAAELIALADEVGADKRAFCEYFKIDGIATMPAKDFDRAKIALNKKRAK
jgi:hypothetical protein